MTMRNFRNTLSSLHRWPVVAVLVLAACTDTGGGVDYGAARASQAAVVASVNEAVVTAHLASSTLETKQAAPGDRFVLLDVAVHNAAAQPQVFSEGKLVNVSESHERSFPTPVSMLADEFLTLQVLEPGARVRGKIAYEVPETMPGVLYWEPGNGHQRILLHPTTSAARPMTSADASALDADTVPSSQPTAIVATPSRMPIEETSTPLPRAPTQQRAFAPAAVAARTASSSAPMRTTATPQPPARTGKRVASIVAAPAAPAQNEQARTLACRALVSRNDLAEKARYLDFFSRECANYAMPPAWLAPTVASTAPAARDGTPRWPPRPGPAFDCSQAYTRAEHLVCEDAVLSLMDWELNRAYAQASRVVDDPDGLQREEDAWRHRVRDACDTAACVESVYDRRTAQLQALTDRQR
jgi:uncharacterized protein YecT (DUF1311 family)